MKVDKDKDNIVIVIGIVAFSLLVLSMTVDILSTLSTPTQTDIGQYIDKIQANRNDIGIHGDIKEYKPWSILINQYGKYSFTDEMGLVIESWKPDNDGYNLYQNAKNDMELLKQIEKEDIEEKKKKVENKYNWIQAAEIK